MDYKTKPYKHQIECFNYSKHHDKFLLADQQGLGKTKEILDIAVAKKEEGCKHCLIICGVNGLKWNWAEEVKIHSNEEAHILGQRLVRGRLKIKDLKARLEDLDDPSLLPYFIILNIECLRQKVKTGRKIRRKRHGRTVEVDEYKYPITDRLCELCESGEIGMIAADECHKMKNPESEQGEQFLRLSAPTQIAATGTPLMNSPLDLYIILKWLGYEDHSYWQFKMHYCVLGGFGGSEVVGYKNMWQINDLLGKMMLRRTKQDVLDLPAKIYKNEYVEMNDFQKSVYNELYKTFRKDIDLIARSANPLSMLTRLRQATGDTGTLSSTIKESAKLDRMEEIVSEIVASGEKVIVFSNWTSITDSIMQRLNKYSPLCITGETADEERQEIVNTFQADPGRKVLVGTIGAAGTGLTLTAASNVIFVDEPWNRALREQAEDRAHRIGQGNPVTIYFLITQGTIDERIHTLVEEKGAISDALIDRKETVEYLLS